MRLLRDLLVFHEHQQIGSSEGCGQLMISSAPLWWPVIRSTPLWWPWLKLHWKNDLVIRSTPLAEAALAN